LASAGVVAGSGVPADGEGRAGEHGRDGQPDCGRAAVAGLPGSWRCWELRGQAGNHAAGPALGESLVRHRGQYCYVAALLPGHPEPTPILRAPPGFRRSMGHRDLQGLSQMS
jgi:hypothetical protein